LELWTDHDSVMTQGLTAVLAKELAEVGIPVTDRGASWTRFLERVDAKKAPAYLITWVADTPDRDSFLSVLFHSRGANNYLNYADPETDRLLDTAGRDMDPQARNRLYKSVEDRVGAANVIIPLFSASNTYALRAGLQGFALDPMGLFDFSRLSWERPR
jgi:ABC-type transport system substrate-binding protein